ncbi:MAG: mono/diheme cytochrome c family protein [Gammaproteobacteria bacterium]|jgi:mono/diheme cytochrome c family protein
MKKTNLNLNNLYLLLMGLLIPIYVVGSEDAVATDEKPYQIIDGNIDNNTLEGWKTFNGGGCGQCHGRGASGGIASNLAESQTVKSNDKEKFNDYVINGYPGTLMAPKKNDVRVMKNLDNLWSYLKARADGVLGYENLIKYPMGKQN